MKKIIALLLTATCMLSMAACGGSTGKDSSENNGKKQVVKVIIQGEPYEPYMQKMAENLEKAGAPYTYEIERVALENLDEKINLAHTAGADYDLIMVNNSSVMQFVNADVLEPLDEFMKSHPDIKENYSESLLQVGAIDGKQYAIPVAPGSRVLAYNKKLLEAGGYTSAPTSQEEIMEISKKLAHDGVYAFTRQMDTTLSPAYNEGCLMQANGAAIAKMGTDGKIVATCDEQSMIDSVKWWQEMMQYCPDDINMSSGQCRAMFDQGRVLFYVFGPWEFNLLENMKYGEDYGLIVPPGSAGTGSTLGGWYMGIGSGSQNKEGALALLEEFIRPENIINLNDGLPADNRCYEMEPFTDPKYEVFAESMEVTKVPFPITGNFQEINDVYAEYFNKCTFGGADVESTMKECNEKIQAMFDKEQ